jgi:tetratricopeptide (TPR) repeat protein
MNLGRLREAEQQFNALLNEPEYKTPFIPFFNLGNLYFQRKDHKQALLYYNEALKEEAKVTTDYRLAIHRQLGHVHYQLGNYEQAYAEFEKVLVLNPRDLESSFQAGMSAMKLGDAENARTMFSRVLVIDPHSPLAEQARQHLNELNN